MVTREDNWNTHNLFLPSSKHRGDKTKLYISSKMWVLVLGVTQSFQQQG